MTRSELLQKAIKMQKEVVKYFENAKDEQMVQINKIELEALLTEQKRSEGCEFCRNKENEHGFFIDGNVLFYEDGKLGTEGIIITTCPRCGRDLMEGETCSTARNGRREEMKDYKVNYVHQDSKTIPDANYTVETSMKTFPDTSPRTVASVLLERWAKDTREMATKTIRSLYSAKMDRYEIPTSTAMYLTRDTEDAIEHYIAYLNSAAEAGK